MAKEGGNDEALALLELRNTPITGTPYSPAQSQLMNKRLRGCLPLTAKALKPSVPTEAKSLLQDCQRKQKHYYDKHSKSLTQDVVHYQTSTSREPAVITQKHSAPRSYNLVTASGNIIRRNRRHLQPTQEASPNAAPQVDDDNIDFSVPPASPPSSSSRPTQPVNASSTQVTEKRTKSGRLVKPRPRYSDN